MIQFPLKARILIPGHSERKEFQLDNCFVASEVPLYIGVICKPSDPAWSQLQASREVLLVEDGSQKPFVQEYRIEVGESTIFFIKPKASAE